MKINELLKKIKYDFVSYNHDILAITDDSSECINNSIFVAIKGNKVDGHDKIDEAISNGAKTIFIERAIKYKKGINYIFVSNTKYILARILKIYYSNILNKLKFIGVIGTNAKTTTSTLIYSLLNTYKSKSMLIGSNGCYADDYYKRHNNTTPKITELYKYFIYASIHKIKFIVMELSSIAISELRINGIEFDTLVFTNFSEDHLDYHNSMDEYFYTKCIPFFNQSKKNNAIINVDDIKSQIIINHSKAKIYTYSKFNNSMIRPHRIINKLTGIEFDYKSYSFVTNLIGSFNIYNILPIFAIAEIYKIDLDLIHSFLLSFKGVRGRMNLYEYNDSYIIIDYAHTEYAVEAVIREASSFNKNKLYVVLGCGGNREKEKRGKIGKILNSYSCEIILTNDNPRFEDPKKIIEEIKANIFKDVVVIENRKNAIEYAFNKLEKNDILLILGKGAEEYIEINGKKEKHSDILQIEALIIENNHSL